MAKIKFMNALPSNRNDYLEIMEDLLLERTNRKKRNFRFKRNASFKRAENTKNVL